MWLHEDSARFGLEIGEMGVHKDSLGYRDRRDGVA